jgi:hypothetical protein
MNKYGIGLEELGKYLEDNRTTAVDILNGINATFNSENVLQ